ncbi:VOC family protein [Flavihumibacter petaseus]|uniref:VOC domain-containing protein n=1 Tax=Flavihumibacter petaseus NBRC 106054 TaxID=1220578 RepID=A0A0E9MVY0_9BACT|nr:VOC family protein [Flavihumibacter petaseus]GAO41658.1 hypothetical protein FPE01S_01_06720 [Flavihumibacter petaseus NBRC 106054]
MIRLPPQRISFITLGVRDLQASSIFYQQKFGWKPLPGESEGIVFFQLHGQIMALFPSDALADDAGIVNNGAGFRRVTLSINCHSEKEVDDIFEGFRANGVTIIKAPAKVFWGGYSGYACDNEDNYWEFAYNPFIGLDDNGAILTS